MNILEAKNLFKNYGSYQALKDINIQVPKGSIYGLLGPNGAGKTSFIRIINQITAPDSGEVFFNEKPLKPEHISQIGYLPEERGLYKKMEVGEQCLYLAQLKGLSKSEAKKKLKIWFEKFEIQGWWNKKVEELSKGMAQKVQFVVTVLHEPELLIFDEPFTGFDPVNAELITKEILDLRKNGSTIIFSTHRMETVEALCDHIALINHAELILQGEVNEIRKSNRTHLFELEFQGNLIAFTNALWTGFELIDKQSFRDNHHKVQLKIIGNNNANSLFQAVMPHVEILGFREILPTMNEIFINTVSNAKN